MAEFGKHEFRYTVGINYDDVRPDEERPTLRQRYAAGRHALGIAQGTAAQVMYNVRVAKAWMQKLVSDSLAYRKRFAMVLVTL